MCRLITGRDWRRVLWLKDTKEKDYLTNKLRKMEIVEFKKGIKDGQEFEYFAHGGNKVEGEFVQLSTRKVFVGRSDMLLLSSIRRLPIIDILKMMQVSNADLYVELEKYRVFLNEKFHKLLCMNIFFAETGDKVGKSVLFEAFEVKYTYETYIRAAKAGRLGIDDINLIVDTLAAESNYLQIATRGETYSLGMFWELLLVDK